jgi:hypothetical protein
MAKIKQPKQPYDPNRSLTIAEFCYYENLTDFEYGKLRKKGWGPRETRVPGTDWIRIKPEHRAAWHERLQSAETLELVRQQRERRAAFAKKAGEKAAESFKHIANVRRRASEAKRAGPPVGKIKKKEAAE